MFVGPTKIKQLYPQHTLFWGPNLKIKYKTLFDHSDTINTCIPNSCLTVKMSDQKSISQTELFKLNVQISISGK